MSSRLLFFRGKATRYNFRKFAEIFLHGVNLEDNLDTMDNVLRRHLIECLICFSLRQKRDKNQRSLGAA